MRYYKVTMVVATEMNDPAMDAAQMELVIQGHLEGVGGIDAVVEIDTRETFEPRCRLCGLVLQSKAEGKTGAHQDCLTEELGDVPPT